MNASAFGCSRAGPASPRGDRLTVLSCIIIGRCTCRGCLRSRTSSSRCASSVSLGTTTVRTALIAFNGTTLNSDRNIRGHFGFPAYHFFLSCGTGERCTVAGHNRGLPICGECTDSSIECFCIHRRSKIGCVYSSVCSSVRTFAPCVFVILPCRVTRSGAGRRGTLRFTGCVSSDYAVVTHFSLASSAVVGIGNVITSPLRSCYTNRIIRVAPRIACGSGNRLTALSGTCFSFFFNAASRCATRGPRCGSISIRRTLLTLQTMCRSTRRVSRVAAPIARAFARSRCSVLSCCLRGRHAKKGGGSLILRIRSLDIHILASNVTLIVRPVRTAMHDSSSRVVVYYNCIPLRLRIRNSTPSLGANFDSVGCPSGSCIPTVHLNGERVRASSPSVPVAVGLHSTRCVARCSSSSRRVRVSRLNHIASASSLSCLFLVSASSPRCLTVVSGVSLRARRCAFASCSLPMKHVVRL